MMNNDYLRIYDEEENDREFSFSNSIERDEPDDKIQDKINRELSESDPSYKGDVLLENEKYREYYEKLNEAKERIRDLKSQISEVKKEINEWEVLLKKIKKQRDLDQKIYNMSIEDNKNIFKIYEGIKGYDQMTESRDYMINNYPIQYEALEFREHYRVVVVIDETADKEYVKRQLDFINDMREKVSKNNVEYSSVSSSRSRVVQIQNRYKKYLENAMCEYRYLKKNYPYKGISRCYIDTNIYIDEVDFGKTLKNTFGPNGSGVIHGIKL